MQDGRAQARTFAQLVGLWPQALVRDSVHDAHQWDCSTPLVRVLGTVLGAHVCLGCNRLQLLDHRQQGFTLSEHAAQC